MSDKFKEMASKAREEHEKTIAAAQAKLEAERAARYQSVDTAVLALRTHVQPVIEQARREFHSKGIEMRVEENYDIKNFSSKNPSIIIKCAGPIRPSDRYQPFSRACIFSSDGQRGYVSGGKLSVVSLERRFERRQSCCDGCIAGESEIINY